MHEEGQWNICQLLDLTDNHNFYYTVYIYRVLFAVFILEALFIWHHFSSCFMIHVSLISFIILFVICHGRCINPTLIPFP